MRSRPARRPRRGAADRAGSRYRDNLARHLIGISRDLQSRVTRSLEGGGAHPGLRPSLGPLLSLLWAEGRSLTTLAVELGVSKQAASQLASHAEVEGYVERRPHPSDRRSKLVVLTRRGRALVERGIGIIRESESDYAALVGGDDYERFTAGLALLYRELDLPSQPDPAVAREATQSVGVLPLIAVRVQRELMRATIARGHPGLKMSHGQVLTLIGAGGGHIHEIARIQRVSRQAISATSLELEALGYLRREPDPRDRRAVVLRLTDRGERLIADSVAALDELELGLRALLGAKSLDRLKRIARDLYRALHLEDEIFESDAPRRVDSRSSARHHEARDGSEIEQLATRLRGRLGRRDAARLAALLEP
jgi:DNA-binding MarR family transcriptional regulator